MMGSKVERGIIPRLCSVLFQMIDSGNSENKVVDTFRVSRGAKYNKGFLGKC